MMRSLLPLGVQQEPDLTDRAFAGAGRCHPGATGVDEPVHQCLAIHGGPERKHHVGLSAVAVDAEQAHRLGGMARVTTPASAWRTTGRAWTRPHSSAFLSRSSPPRRPATAPVWGWRWCMAS